MILLLFYLHQNWAMGCLELIKVSRFYYIFKNKIAINFFYADDCISDGRPVRHGEEISSNVTCLVCVCYYGNIVCQEPQCPQQTPKCRISSNITQNKTLCCPELICGEFSNWFLNKSFYTSIYFSEDQLKPELNTTKNQYDDFSLDSVLSYFLGDKETSTDTLTKHSTFAPSTKQFSKLPLSTLPVETATENRNKEKFSPHPNSIDSAPGVGILKLAGCNIYGRMYRVGRIIFELSGPCLECKCTEIGVQCEALKC